MMSVFADPSSRAFARLTGALYLTIAVSGGFAIAYVPAALNVAGDPAAALGTIAVGRGLFLAGVAGDVVKMLAETAAATMLYFMFRTVNPALSAIAMTARLMMVAVMASMLFFSAAALGIAEGTHLVTLPQAMRADWLALMLRLDEVGVWIWQVFFALHLLVLGYLVRQSGQYPGVLGWGMSLGATGYALDSLHGFAFPENGVLEIVTIGFLALVTLAEIGFALWLVIRGPRVPRP
jgi:hypothetical protein